MLKKRIIFTLLFDKGQFMLSRNFRLQKVGNLDWLQRNYNFADVAFFIDELIVLDVSRGERDRSAFCRALAQISEGCFAPIAAGGGIDSVDYAKALLRAGADKVVVNTALVEQPELVQEIAREFGQQCVVGSVDLKRNPGGYNVYIRDGSEKLDVPVSEVLGWHARGNVGEIYLNSIDRDGTGQGYDFDTLSLLPEGWNLPVILAGGVGNAKHFAEGLMHDNVDAVATAHLFNFVGDGLKKARNALLDSGAQLATWDDIISVNLRRHLESA
ncbi:MULTISPECIES: imidazole glycerol phosphate synthase cyclase subunit [Kordiimonas]|jgi:cyclase|uniref:imidazole glycerol phosphate synthase cyclase subunit n=1 Tax=Kordiimonas TaxID=288021 RepID=UPI00257CFA10|nr:imidazole glycerol phosphate synthase cyclase subunit [Kordiimonas sp. UBA4487]